MAGMSFPGFASYMHPPGGFRTPWSALGQNVISHQGTMCEQFEMNFYRCCEAFGLVASKRKCDLEYRDLLECVYRKKQKNRQTIMQKEYFKQWMQGKRDWPYTTNPPKMYLVWPDWYEHENIIPLRPYY